MKGPSFASWESRSLGKRAAGRKEIRPSLRGYHACALRRIADVLKLSARKQNALEELGIFTWGDLLHRLLTDSPAVKSILRGKDVWWEECEWLEKKMRGVGATEVLANGSRG